MPLFNSTYQPPVFLVNGHLQTIFAALCRRVSSVCYQRERIDTLDNDFVDLDWSCIGSRKLAIVSHGMEGSSTRSYMLGMVKALNRVGWDALAWNQRGCSGEPNRKPHAYHFGFTVDFESVILHALQTKRYQEIALVGFSMGGNITLKWLGEQKDRVDPRIIRAVVISVPCHMPSTTEKLESLGNRLYRYRFLRTLKAKTQVKKQLFPEIIDISALKRMRSFQEFDNRYTAPLHGFADAEEYYEKASALPHLMHIRIPTLVINAQDDPFLTPQCFPTTVAEKNPQFFLEIPKRGGHVGFVTLNHKGEYWSESRTIAFLNSVSSYRCVPLEEGRRSVGHETRSRMTVRIFF